MFRHKYAIFGAGCLLAATIACSNTASPISPDAGIPSSAGAGPSGETLKIAAPATVAPTGGTSVDLGFGLIIGNVTGTYATFPVRYRYEIRNEAGTTVVSGTQAAGSGTQTNVTISQSLEFDTLHTWRVRAEYNGAFGPWSAPASFRTAAGSFINDDTVLDLLTDGETLGDATNVQFSSAGAYFPSHNSYIAYRLPSTIKNGEFSFIATGVDEGNPCDKCKVISMGEGGGDVTANDYRVSLEVRGSAYTQPGMVAFRLITGDAADHGRIHDTDRNEHWPEWSRAQTYFFRVYWGTGFAGYEIREGSATGNMHDAARITTDTHEYRPTPHYAFVGSPIARGGAGNSTHLGMTVKSVWISPDDRPNLPTIINRPQ
ncbi:MAG: hypothetical protein M3Q55_01585 [Acidobacteriota bacterium]|nr:hypothetical protein [Acidobacteriota bacterium]